MSGGQKKLLELARTLMADPTIVLLDEPAAGVNPTLMGRLRERIETLNRERGITFLLIEHDMPLVMGLWLWRDHRGTLRTDPLRLAATLGLVLSAAATLIVAGYLSGSGAHWVGNVTSDAGGLPLVGWSQRVGDLRVAHFCATHGMQMLPLLGFALRKRGTRGSLYVVAATAAWLVTTGGAFLQALLGQPVLSLH